MTCSQSTPDPCACAAVFPQPICNPGGLKAIGFRIGDFVAFRNQLLLPLADETELTAWRPNAAGDLAVQMMEWWAYLGDILTFYNERIANEAYLRTALLPESVNHLVQLLGYRPKPALGAKGQLAALLSSSARLPVTLPAGLQVQSKPPPGQSPQIFQVDQAATITLPDVITAVVSPANPRLFPSGGGDYVWLAGKVSGIKPADRLLLINNSALTTQSVSLQDYAWISVVGTSAQSDPLGNPVTQVNFTTVAGSIAAGAQATNYALLRPSQSSPLWGYSISSPVAVVGTAAASTTVVLAGVARSITPGSLLLMDVSDGIAKPGTTLVPLPVIVQSYAEVVWYANGNGPAPPPNSSPPPTPIGFPVAQIGFASLDTTGDAATLWNENVPQLSVRWGWTRIGQLAPVLSASDLTWSGSSTTALVPAPGAASFPTLPAAVFLEDPAGDAVSAAASAAPGVANGIVLNAVLPQPPPDLASPVSVFFNQVAVSRGKTVPAEILGSGNPSVAGQDFALQQSPVTYFFDPASISGPNFTSTVQVSVNGVLWKEVQSFYGQAPNAQVFVLHEDDQGQTHVSFGDGVNGSLLPTGANNVVATYRYGAGAAAPPAETLTVVLTPAPGLKGMRNPLPPTGGGDPDPPADLRKLAPESVLTFNRAVSLDDYAALAMTASGVTQALAEYAFDPLAQRALVMLWIAGDSNAVAAAAAVLAATSMPNQGLRIQPATALTAVLSLTYLRDPRYADADLQVGLTTALLDPDNGLLGANVLGIGQPIYQSQIAAACLAVPGVEAIQGVTLVAGSGFSRLPIFLRLIRRFGPTLQPLGCAGQGWSPGAGNYISVPNDGLHLILTGAVAS